MYDFTNTLRMSGKDYDLVRYQGVPEDKGRMVWIARITDESGQQITSARIYDVQDKAHETAMSWLNGLLRTNQGKLMRLVMTAAKDQY